LDNKLRVLTRQVKQSWNSLNKNAQQDAEGDWAGNRASNLTVAVLEGHIQTINHITQGRVEDDARQQNRTLCGLYGQWVVGQFRENLDQVSRGTIPALINDEQIEHLYRGPRLPNISNCRLQQLTKVWSNDSCRGIPGTARGRGLGIPVILKSKRVTAL